MIHHQAKIQSNHCSRLLRSQTSTLKCIFSCQSCSLINYTGYKHQIFFSLSDQKIMFFWSNVGTCKHICLPLSEKWFFACPSSLDYSHKQLYQIYHALHLSPLELFQCSLHFYLLEISSLFKKRLHLMYRLQLSV